MNQTTLGISAWDYSYFATLMIVGSICHFLFNALGKPVWAGFIFPTNESTFQHLKMLILPSVIFFFIQFFTSGLDNQGFLLSRFCGLFIGMVAICVFFYTYSALLGITSLLWILFPLLLGLLPP